MRQNYSCILLVCFLACSLKLYAQKPNFTVALDKSCSPVIATFTNASTGFSAGAIYSLNFGEGTSGNFISTTLTHSYLTGGTYTATLTVTDNGNSYTATNQIVIYKNPVVNFSPNLTKVCAKNAVGFTSTSTAGDGTIADYLWDFGDGTVSDTLANKVSHTYTSGSKITAGLTVTNSYGCATSATLPNIVTVLSAPKAGFSASTTTACHITDAISFTNTTLGAQPISYLWNFGDGTTAMGTNAVHGYATKGKFTVILAATSSEGCTDTSAGTIITVATAKSGITAPALLCLNSNSIFIDSSSPKTAHPVWLLDDKTVASDVHQYTTQLTDTNLHTLQLVNTYGSCTDTATKLVKAQTVPKPSPFTYQLKGYCNAASPTAAFTEAGTGGVTWEWDFNNTNETVFHPTVFTQNPNYTYPAAGTYYIQLRVTDASGCTGTIRQPVTIAKNTLAITSMEGIFGCHNLATTFKATSTTPIAQYNWMFSDDNSTSTADTPHHTFAALGGYSAFLKIKTTTGCTDTSRVKLYIGNEPKFTFAVLNPGDTSVCGNKTIQFKITGNSDSLIGTYYWNFGDAPAYTLVNYDSIFTHQYLTDGAFTVSMAIKNHGCNDTVTKTNYIKVMPPFAKISNVVYNCDTRLKVAFKETSVKAQTFTWDFGDGSPTYTYDSLHRDMTVAHTFPGTNLYKVVLITGSGNCTVRDSSYVRTLDNQKPVLSTTQTSICASDTLHTTVSGMANNPFGTAWKYTVKAIECSNGSPFTGAYSYPDVNPANPFHIDIENVSNGNRQLRIITNSGAYNCPDTTNFISVQVNGPRAGFKVGDSVLCLSDKAIFKDASQAGSLAPITKWQWLYGDGTADTLTASGNTFHHYANPGIFGARLIVTDKQNCRDTAYYPANLITIKGPKATFSIAQNPVLPNTPETFVNLTDAGSANRANNSYSWLFGDGSNDTSNKDNIVHSYNQYGDDTVTLVAKSSSTGCSDTATSIVHVKNTNLSFTYTSKFLNPKSTCPPVLVYFKNTSVNFGIVSWNFGDSLTADNINTPTHTYYKPGVYKVTIYGYYANNSYDSSWEYINIAGPSAVLHADAVAGCGSRQVMFTATTQNTSSLLWDFGDGTSSPDSVATHVYTTSNVYTPTITVKKDANCAASYSLATPIVIDSLRINIAKDSVLQCHQLLVNFTPTVTFSLAKNHGQTLDYTWQFGNGSTASKKDTGTTTYFHSGVYPVSLIATSPYGCKDTVAAQVSYHEIPFASINGQSEFCEHTPVAFTAVKTNNTDALTYHWQFQNDSSTLQTPPAQTFVATGNHTIILWVNKNGCTDTVSQQLTIHSQPHVSMLVSDSIVCLGSPILFDVKPVGNTADSLQYFWNLGDGKDSAAIKSANFVYAANGTYPVLFRTTSSFGCKEELRDTVAVSPTPHVFINAPIDICKNGTVTFTSASTSGSSAQYLWHFSDATTSTQQNPSPKTYNTAGTNTVYVIAKLGNCYDTAYHQLTVHDNPQVNLTATAQSVCLGDTVQLTAHNGKDYQWAINNVVTGANVASPRLAPNTNTKYSVLVTDGNGCRNADSLTVAVVKQQHISVASTFINVCAGNEAKFSASGTDTYHWINGSDLTATDVANPSTKNSAQNKNYIVVGSDGHGCFTDTASVQVTVRNNPIIQVDNSSSNITTPAGAPTQLSASSANNIVTWNWQPAVYLSCSNCAAPISKPRQNLRYLVEGTDNFGCKGVDTVLVNVICKENLAGVPEIFSPNGDGRNDRFGIAGYGIKNIKHFVIFGRNGNKVFERNNVSAFDTNATWDGTCNNVQMPVGTYIYIIEATCDAGEMYNLKGTITLVR